MAGLSEPSRRRQARPGRARLLATGAAALVAPALLIVQRLQGGDPQVGAIAGAWAVLFVLVMVRMAGLVRGIERAEADRRRVLDRTVQAAEAERGHVAGELHDGPIQRLAVLSYDLERAKQRMLGNPTAVARVEHAQSALSAEVQGLRELMASLRPPTLDEVGLEAALRDHVGAFARRSGVDCSVRVDLDGRPRRGGAGRLWLELEGAGDQVDLRIADDGVGFEPRTSSTWSATATSAWPPCRSGSRWPAATSRSRPAPAPASSSAPTSGSTRPPDRASPPFRPGGRGPGWRPGRGRCGRGRGGRSGGRRGRRRPRTGRWRGPR
jgi:Histidine kinase